MSRRSDCCIEVGMDKGKKSWSAISHCVFGAITCRNKSYLPFAVVLLTKSTNSNAWKLAAEDEIGMMSKGRNRKGTKEGAGRSVTALKV